MFIEGPLVAMTEELLELSKKKITMVVDLLTEHCPNKHLHTVGIVEDSTFSACCEHEEDSQNLLGLVFTWKAPKILGVQFVKHKNFKKSSINNVLTFMES